MDRQYIILLSQTLSVYVKYGSALEKSRYIEVFRHVCKKGLTVSFIYILALKAILFLSVPGE